MQKATDNGIDQIIARYADAPAAPAARKKEVAFRPLSKQDEECFAGAGPNALMADTPWGVVILDGRRVEAYFADDAIFDTDLHEHYLPCVMPNEAVADLVAEYIADMKTATEAALYLIQT